MGQRNPSWTRDELILALDLYFRHRPRRASDTHPRIVEVSRILRALPIHADRPDPESFRSPASVCSKLSNFLYLDPSYKGDGLSHYGKLDAEIWSEFYDDRDRLRELSKAISATADSSIASALSKIPTEEDDWEGVEGAVLRRIHKYKERDRKLAEQKKKSVLANRGALACEVCTFDFSVYYGKHGEGYIECHHLIPLEQLRPNTSVLLEDLAVVCSNCHRMLHYGRRFLGLDELRELMQEIALRSDDGIEEGEKG